MLGEILAGLGLSLAADKTRIVHVADGSEGYDFLGFHHRMIPSRRNPNFRYPACWPSDRAMRQARSRVRELTGAATPPRQPPTLHGAFYRRALYPVLHRINTYLLRWIMKKHKQRRTWKKALQAMRDAIKRQPRYFAHWAWAKPATR